jgi:hypothetical protein
MAPGERAELVGPVRHDRVGRIDQKRERLDDLLAREAELGERPPVRGQHFLEPLVRPQKSTVRPTTRTHPPLELRDVGHSRSGEVVVTWASVPGRFPRRGGTPPERARVPEQDRTDKRRRARRRRRHPRPRAATCAAGRRGRPRERSGSGRPAQPVEMFVRAPQPRLRVHRIPVSSNTSRITASISASPRWTPPAGTCTPASG